MGCIPEYALEHAWFDVLCDTWLEYREHFTTNDPFKVTAHAKYNVLASKWQCSSRIWNPCRNL